MVTTRNLTSSTSLSAAVDAALAAHSTAQLRTLGVAPITSAFTKSILIVVCGQSIRLGAAKRYNAALGATTSPAAYTRLLTRSAAKPSMTDPIAPKKARGGSYWPRVVDKLADQGIDCDIVLAAIGSSSVRHWIGEYRSWKASTVYCQQRASLNGDAGDKGEFIIANSQLWRCTTGNTRTAYNTLLTSPDSYSNTSTLTSGTSAPNWASVTTVGSTIADGGLVWTLVENSTTKTTGDALDPTSTYGDPLGLCARAGAAGDAAIASKLYDEVWYLWGTASAEVSVPRMIVTSTANNYATDEVFWRNRLQAFTNWALVTKSAGYVALGLDTWFPDLGPSYGVPGSNRALYDIIERGLERAVNSYQGGTYDGRVFRAGNFYRPVAGQAPNFSPLVYPETGLTYGVHPTEQGSNSIGDVEAAAILARSAGASVIPYIEVAFDYPFCLSGGNAVTTAANGTVLTAFDGNWLGGPTLAATRQWYRDGTAISGQTGTTYTTVAGDAGHTISVASTKANALGSGTPVMSATVSIT